MNYTGVDAKYVIEKLGKGETVLLCDFATGRIMDCSTMTVAAINNFIPRTDCKWFVVTEVANG